MKAVYASLAASLVAGVSAHQHRQHAHLHKKHEAGSPVEKRDPDVVTHYVVGATETVYELNGEIMKAEEAKAGLDGENYVVVGETEPTYVPPPPPPKPKTTSVKPSSSVDLGAQFIESVPPKPKPTKSAAPPPPPAAKPKPKPKPAPKPKAAPKPKPAPPTYDTSDDGGEGVDRPFPDGVVPCSEFPSAYGAVKLDWLGFDGWSGLQKGTNWSKGVSAIADIVTGIDGDTCGKGDICSYACPPGYQKSQWPQAQGSTKQSVGGLHCGPNGKLYKTRAKFDTLCQKGAGGITTKNKLGEVVSICRTDYPGTESMVIPFISGPGGSVELTNPIASEDYVWDNKLTSAQYYINKKGIPKNVACQWNSPGHQDDAGNWAPANLGASVDKTGTTFIGLFQNYEAPDQKLDFNIKITGDFTGECGYDAKSQKFYGNGGKSDGCTVS